VAFRQITLTTCLIFHLFYDHHCFLFSALCFVISYLSWLDSLDYIFTFLSHSHHCKALNSLICADVPLRHYSLTHFKLLAVDLPNYKLVTTCIFWEFLNSVVCCRQPDHGVCSQHNSAPVPSPSGQNKLTKMPHHCHTWMVQSCSPVGAIVHHTCFFGPTGVHIPNSIWIGSAVFCTAHDRESLYFTIGHPFSPQNCPFTWGIWTPV